MAERSLTERNWSLHGWLMGALATGWIVLVLVEQNRHHAGLSDLGEAILMVLATFGALGYALLSTLMLWAVQAKRFGVVIAHGALVAGALLALLFLYLTGI